MTSSSIPNTTPKYILKATLFCIVFTGLLVLFSFFKSFIDANYERFAYGIIATFVAFLTTYIFLSIDKKKFSDIGLKFERSTILKFLTGVLIGIIVMALMALSIIYFSGFKIEINHNSSILNFLFWTSPLILLSLMEEIGFRAYPLVILKDKAGIRMSIIITSILFALYHIANGWSVIGSFTGPGVCGIFFGLAAIYSNGISMPTGIHYAFDLTTSAFAVTNTSFNLWVLKDQNGASLEHYQTDQAIALIPQISLLIFGVICMELFLKKRQQHKTPL